MTNAEEEVCGHFHHQFKLPSQADVEQEVLAPLS